MQPEPVTKITLAKAVQLQIEKRNELRFHPATPFKEN